MLLVVDQFLHEKIVGLGTGPRHCACVCSYIGVLCWQLLLRDSVSGVLLSVHCSYLRFTIVTGVSDQEDASGKSCLLHGSNTYTIGFHTGRGGGGHWNLPPCIQ